ncbi:hypothetical protein V9T40_001958 [Parthenolecanium corni]|uniref:Cuticle protein n=1 Tax=Parthenolecanium corni TaxID=536013 RepID=A0AAN9TFP9_9HEMI
MAFAVKMIIAAVAALALASQVSCKPLTPFYSAPVIAAAPAAAVTTYHAPAVATYHAPAYPVASVAHVPAVTTHVASYPSYSSFPATYGYYGARYAAAVPAVSAYHYPAAAAAVSYPAAATYGYGYPSGFSSTTYHHPYSPYSTTLLHK